MVQDVQPLFKHVLLKQPAFQHPHASSLMAETEPVRKYYGPGYQSTLNAVGRMGPEHQLLPRREVNSFLGTYVNGGGKQTAPTTLTGCLLMPIWLWDCMIPASMFRTLPSWLTTLEIGRLRWFATGDISSRSLGGTNPLADICGST